MIRHLQARAESATRLRWYRTLEEALPNVRFVEPDGTRVAPSVLAAVGSVARVEEGRGFHDDEATGRSREVPFDDPAADWRTLHIHVDELAVLGGEAPGDELVVGLSISGADDVGVLKRDVEALGRILLLLSDSSPVFAYDRSLYSILDDGELLGLVDQEGRVTFPVLDAAMAGFQGELQTVDDIRRAAREPRTEIALSGGSGVPARPT